MSNSQLVQVVKISPNKYTPRASSIDTITIHCYVGQATVESMLENFSRNINASCNYVIGTDGRVGLCVDEQDGSWCSSNYNNDNRAVTIECACDKVHPYAINSKVYQTLVSLCADICKRNSIKELKWLNDKSLIGQVGKQNMTVHRWFKNKACPGEFIFDRLGQIASEVNSILNPPAESKITNTLPATTPFVIEVVIPDLNVREKPSMDSKIAEVTGYNFLTVVEVRDGWGKLKSGAGWIWLLNPQYVSIPSASSTPASSVGLFKVRVSVPDLNIRTGPGTNYAKVKGYIEEGVFHIVDTKTGKGSNSGWGLLMSGTGWISLDYVERI